MPTFNEIISRQDRADIDASIFSMAFRVMLICTMIDLFPDFLEARLDAKQHN